MVKPRQYLLRATLERALKEHALSDLLEEVERISRNERSQTLTIVANRGIHPIPKQFLEGRVVFASKGSLPERSAQDAARFIERALSRVAGVLKERSWRTVNLIPTGHPVLSGQLKLLVYRILRIETSDLCYLGARGYFRILISQRGIIKATRARAKGGPPRPRRPRRK